MRLRLHDPAWSDPDPPDFVWEDPAHPALAELRDCLPEALRAATDPWEQVLRLSTFVADHWAPVHLKSAFEYTPWDPFAIMSWVKSREGLSRRDPVGFCVHGAVLFTTACLALGIPARNYCISPGLELSSGHFISEVWHAGSRQWRQVDAKCDVTYQQNGHVLSLWEMVQQRPRLNEFTVPGPSYARQESHIHDFITGTIGTGTSYRHIALWPRNDYLSHPELTPPAHGTVAYCETSWQWLDASADGPLGMFPVRRAASTLLAPPPPPWDRI